MKTWINEHSRTVGFTVLIIGLLFDLPFFPLGMQALFVSHSPYAPYVDLILLVMVLLPLSIMGYGLYLLIRGPRHEEYDYEA